MNFDSPKSFDLRNLHPSLYENPYPVYAILRAYSPVHQLPDGSWFLTRYCDLDRIYRDPETFSSDKRVEFGPKFGNTPLFEHHTTSLVFNDPPLHSRVRKILAGALTPRAIAALEQSLVALVDGLLDDLEERGTIDIVDDYASAVPIEVIGNLLSIPHSDRAPLRDWSLAILGALEPSISEVAAARGNKAVVDFCDYLRGLVAERRKHPGDPNVDVLTRLIKGSSGGKRLSEAELLHNCIFILNAGHETTTNLIGNGLHLMLAWPDQRLRLHKQPGRITSAVEEFLRQESPNQLGNRIASIPTEIGGVRIPEGARLNLCIGAANRDPLHFENPDTLDITRTPNRHLAFAGGPHHCAGASLARLEAKVAIGRFIARFPNFELQGLPKRQYRARFRGFEEFQVNLGGTRRAQS